MELAEAITLLKTHQLAISVKPFNALTSRLVIRDINDQATFEELRDAINAVCFAHHCAGIEIGYNRQFKVLELNGARAAGLFIYSDPELQRRFSEILSTKGARGIVPGQVDFEALDFETAHGRPDHYIDPVLPVAAALVKEGVNFPGSEKFIPKSPN